MPLQNANICRCYLTSIKKRASHVQAAIGAQAALVLPLFGRHVPVAFESQRSTLARSDCLNAGFSEPSPESATEEASMKQMDLNQPATREHVKV